MLQLSLILSVLMILSALIPFGLRFRWLCLFPCLAWLLIWGFAVLLLCNVYFAPAIGWLYLFLIIAFLLVRLTKLNWVWFQSICLCCTLIAFGIALVEFIPVYHEHRELLAKYPAVDLRDRLAYEKNFLKQVESPSDRDVDSLASFYESPKYDAEALQHLIDESRVYLDVSIFPIEYRRNDRRLALQALMRAHEEFVADFIAQPGVGRSRIPGWKLLRKSNFIDEVEGVILDAPSELIEQPDPQQHISDTALSAEQTERQSLSQPDHVVPNLSAAVPAPEILQDLHLHNITNFVPLNSLGGVNQQLQARGFEAHAFRLAPSKTQKWENGPGEWRLARLELVSLLRNRPPAVYVSAHLPAMDELRHAPTRPVNDFESDAIAKLFNGEELVVEHRNDRELRMVGSIRAITDCRECHQVPLGGLLGAFSYRLKPASDDARQSK